MTFLYTIIFIIVYIAIGGFIVGFMDVADDGGFEMFVTFFWPVLLVILVILLAIRLPAKAGKKVNEWIERRAMDEED